MKNLSFRKFNIWFFFYFFSFFTHVCSQLSFPEVSREKGSLEVADFIVAIGSINNVGTRFEMESALCLKLLGKDVLGLNLFIAVIYPQSPKIYINLEDNNFELKAVEYDIVTSDGVYECKSSNRPNRYKKRSIEQFLKEKNMLEFFKNIYSGMQNSKEDFYFGVYFNEKANKKHCILTLWGRATNFQYISFISNWVKGDNLEACTEQWFRIIELLAGARLEVMFKQKISSNFKERLAGQNLNYKDEVNYQNYLSADNKLQKMIGHFEQLSIT